MTAGDWLIMAGLGAALRRPVRSRRDQPVHGDGEAVMSDELPSKFILGDRGYGKSSMTKRMVEEYRQRMAEAAPVDAQLRGTATGQSPTRGPRTHRPRRIARRSSPSCWTA